MSKRVLVTGATGFTGKYLRAALEGRGYQVVGLAGRNHAAGSDDLKVDILDAAATREVVASIAPDFIIHLAGISFIVSDEPEEFYRTHVFGTLNLLEASAHSPVRKIIIPSTSNVYGRPLGKSVNEADCPMPVSHYGVSKLAMELVARMWFERLPIVVVRPFNYTGAGQSERFVLPKLVGHFRRNASHIDLGDTSVVREFMDVRDIVNIYVRLLECPAVGEVVNVCSGSGLRLEHVLDMLRRLTGRDVKVRKSPSLIRANEIGELVGSPEKLAALIGPPAFRPLEETLRWMLAA
jgi:nucleoside-diphosphate-sugar epimerase